MDLGCRLNSHQISRGAQLYDVTSIGAIAGPLGAPTLVTMTPHTPLSPLPGFIICPPGPRVCSTGRFLLSLFNQKNIVRIIIDDELFPNRQRYSCVLSWARTNGFAFNLLSLWFVGGTLVNTIRFQECRSLTRHLCVVLWVQHPKPSLLPSPFSPLLSSACPYPLPSGHPHTVVWLCEFWGVLSLLLFKSLHVFPPAPDSSQSTLCVYVSVSVLFACLVHWIKHRSEILWYLSFSDRLCHWA